MLPFSIPCATATGLELSWLEGFEDVRNEEIENAIILLRGMTAACTVELADRSELSSEDIQDAFRHRLHATAKRINKRGFSPDHETYLNNWRGYILEASDAQKERNENKAARQYLRLLSMAVGWSHALLVLCALGKSCLRRLDDNQRVKILRYVSRNRGSLSCSRLEEKAKQFDLERMRR